MIYGPRQHQQGAPGPCVGRNHGSFFDVEPRLAQHQTQRALAEKPLMRLIRLEELRPISFAAGICVGNLQTKVVIYPHLPVQSPEDSYRLRYVLKHMEHADQVELPLIILYEILHQPDFDRSAGLLPGKDRHFRIRLKSRDLPPFLLRQPQKVADVRTNLEKSDRRLGLDSCTQEINPSSSPLHSKSLLPGLSQVASLFRIAVLEILAKGIRIEAASCKYQSAFLTKVGF